MKYFLLFLPFSLNAQWIFTDYFNNSIETELNGNRLKMEAVIEYTGYHDYPGDTIVVDSILYFWSVSNRYSSPGRINGWQGPFLVARDQNTVYVNCPLGWKAFRCDIEIHGKLHRNRNVYRWKGFSHDPAIVEINNVRKVKLDKAWRRYVYH